MIDRVIRLASKPKPASRIEVKGGGVVVNDRHLRFVPFSVGTVRHKTQPHVGFPAYLSVPGERIWPGTGQRLQVQQQTRNECPTCPGRNQILVDGDRVSQPFMVRSWLPGDRFHPRGMGGRSKKLQDFFTDLKIPVAARLRIPLVVAPEGILWVVGYRQDERWMPTAATERCLVFTVDHPTPMEGTE